MQHDEKLMWLSHSRRIAEGNTTQITVPLEFIYGLHTSLNGTVDKDNLPGLAFLSDFSPPISVPTVSVNGNDTICS